VTDPRQNIHLHQDDLPEGLDLGDLVAIDSEPMGLNPVRDRLCLVQLSAGDGEAHLVQIRPDAADAPRLTALLENPDILKIFHFARFDVGAFFQAFDVLTAPVYCTKVASKLVRTMTDRHGLKDLCKEIVGVDISKQQQSSDWGAAELTEDQKLYAATDVFYLHQIKAHLDGLLEREHRLELAQACFDFLPYRAALDIFGWPDEDILAH
jgi:ribonuclease D